MPGESSLPTGRDMPGESSLPTGRDMPGESRESTTRTPVLTEFELNALVDVAAAAAEGPMWASPPTGAYTSEEEQRKAEEAERQRRVEEEARQKAALDRFTTALNARLARAYYDGVNEAVDRADRSSFNARSITLYLVVLAVVAMPFVAMIIHLSPQAFGSYIAPITAIAGTVVGYWFGALSRSGKSNDSAR
jgi:hypothetical protein